MSDQQAVVEQTDAQATPAVEGAGAQDDLDTLLKEFEGTQETKSETKTETKPDTTTEDREAIEWAKQQRVKTYLDETRSAINEAAKAVKGDLPVDDELAEGFLHAKAFKDERFKQAFINREKSPDAWSKVLKGMNAEFAKKFADMPDAQVSEDRAAVAAAVRGASTKASEPTPPDFSKMSDAEFRKFKESLA